MRCLPALLLLLLSPVLAACGAGGFVDALTSGSEDSGNVDVSDGGSGAAMSDGERAFALEVLRLVNEERAKVSVAALEWDESAAGVAYGHSVDMDARNFFSHVNPSGQDPGARIAAAGLTGYFGWGENIARGQGSPAEVMNTWMSSQGHRDNILFAGHTHLGVGVHAPGDIWWTQVFLDRAR